MKIKKIIYSIIILFLIYSCGTNKTPNEPDDSSTTNDLNKEFDYPFVINEKEIKGKCIEMYKDWLKPTNIESVELLSMYKLDIELDSVIYKSDTYKNAFFVGVKYRFDKEVSHLIWALLFESGAIYSCSYVNSDSILLINNGNVYFTNFSPFQKECLNLNEDRYITKLGDVQIGYWSVNQASSFFGHWVKGDFHNKTNELWNFERGDNFEDFGNLSIIKKTDTLLNCNYQISEDSLIFHHTNLKSFEIKTFTKSAIVILDNENSNEIVLTKK